MLLWDLGKWLPLLADQATTHLREDGENISKGCLRDMTKQKQMTADISDQYLAKVLVLLVAAKYFLSIPTFNDL